MSCRWLGQQAEALGVEIYPGFAAAELLEEDGRIVGIATGDMGIGKDGKPTENFQRGMELRARYTLFAEGCRGSLSKQLIRALRPARRHRSADLCASASRSCGRSRRRTTGRAWSSTRIGWPLDAGTYGGSFLYHFGENLVSYGFVVGLDYRNPWLSPFDEMQRFKTHPEMRKHFEGGRRITYGARALNEGGLQSMPKLTFPGGALIGDTAGFMNVPKIKGTHTAMKSGMLAAEAVAEALPPAAPAELPAIRELRASWVWRSCRVRNVRPAFAKFGLWGGLAYSAFDTYLLRGKAPWTFHHPHPDNETLMEAEAAPRIDYPRPDGVLTFDRLSSVFISNTNHEENQPAHLQLARSRTRRSASTGTASAARRRGTARRGSTRSSAPRKAIRGCRSTRRTACTARPATSRIRRRTSTG